MIQVKRTGRTTARQSTAIVALALLGVGCRTAQTGSAAASIPPVPTTTPNPQPLDAKELEALLNGTWTVTSQVTRNTNCTAREGDEKNFVHQWLIAADGEKKTVRITVLGETGFPKFSGSLDQGTDGSVSLMVSGASEKKTALSGGLVLEAASQLVSASISRGGSLSGERYVAAFNVPDHTLVPCTVVFEATGKKQ